MDDDVDAVLLDRHMPGRSGDDVLAELRTEYDTPVAFVSAVEPTVDIVDVPFDEYLQKPASKDDLYQLVDTLVGRSRLDASTRETLAARTKIDVLNENTERGEVPDHDAFLELLEKADYDPTGRSDSDPSGE